jgi:aminoglycoside phosphotransferase (APT) family kinase protein
MSLPKDLVARIEQAFRKRDPEIQSMAIDHIEEIVGGWESPIYSFTSQTMREGGVQSSGHVIRFYTGLEATAKAHKDFRVMERVSQLGVPTPKLDFVIDDTGDDEAYLVMEKIEGKTAAHFLQAKDEVDGRALMELAAYQAMLHGLDWRDIWIPKNAELLARDASGYVEDRLVSLKETIKELGSGDFDCVIAWLDSKVPGNDASPVTFIHNDYHPENAVLREADEALFIIDWGFAEPGDARMDLAWTLLQVSLMLGRNAREAYLSAYEDAASQSVEHLAFFEALKFTERMVTIAQWLQSGFEIPIRKISQESLRGSYKVHIVNVYARLKEVTACTIPLIEAL